MDAHPFEGMTALVTGGARRLGKALALRLGTLGADVVVHHHASGPEAFAVCSQLQALGVEATAIQADLSDPAAAGKLVEQARKAAGKPIRLLVNNASDYTKAHVDDLDWKTLESSLRLDAWAPFAASRALASQAGKHHAAIVNVLDTRIADYDWEHTGYYLAKRMLADLTRLLAVELAPNVTVNGVAPGPVAMSGGEDLSKVAKHLPLRRLVDPEDVADAVLFLLGARSVTGQVIHVDGGRHLGRAVYE